MSKTCNCKPQVSVHVNTIDSPAPNKANVLCAIEPKNTYIGIKIETVTVWNNNLPCYIMSWLSRKFSSFDSKKVCYRGITWKQPVKKLLRDYRYKRIVVLQFKTKQC